VSKENNKDINNILTLHNANANMGYDSWDYLDMAYQADNMQDALKYAKNALQLDENCLDAQVMIAELTSANSEELKVNYEKFIEKAQKHLKKQGLFDDEEIGHFWGLVETRPYMRLKHSYLRLLLDQGKFRKSIKECEDMIRLSENDNLGVRYLLISLYAFFEDELNLIKLYKKYDEESNSQMLLPIVALYYKLDNYDKAKVYLNKLREVNDEAEDFFCSEDIFETMDMEEVIETGSYRYASKEEIMVAMSDSAYLYSTSAGLILWIAENIGKQNSSK